MLSHSIDEMHSFIADWHASTFHDIKFKMIQRIVNAIFVV